VKNLISPVLSSAGVVESQTFRLHHLWKSVLAIPLVMSSIFSVYRQRNSMNISTIPTCLRAVRTLQP